MIVQCFTGVLTNWDQNSGRASSWFKNRTETMGTVVGIMSSFQWKAVYIPAAIPEGQVSHSHHRYENDVKQSYNVYFASLSLYANFFRINISQSNGNTMTVKGTEI
jgi:hypothetical protein